MPQTSAVIRGEPRLLISTDRGRERRVARDLMDALYPHDRGIRLELFEGGLLVHSSLSADHILSLLQQYPVRGLLRVRRVLTFAEGGLEAAVEELLLQAARSGLRLRAVEVRTGGSIRRRELEGLVASWGQKLGLFSREGVRARVLLLRREGGGWLLILAA